MAIKDLLGYTCFSEDGAQCGQLHETAQEARECQSAYYADVFSTGRPRHRYIVYVAFTGMLMADWLAHIPAVKQAECGLVPVFFRDEPIPPLSIGAGRHNGTDRSSPE